MKKPSNNNTEKPLNPMQMMLERARAAKSGAVVDVATGKVSVDTGGQPKKPQPVAAGRPAVVQKSQRGR
jgi:hypothetical protein